MKWFKRKTKTVRVVERYNWTPASSAMGESLKIVNPIKAYAVSDCVKSTTAPSKTFESTQASKWSTADAARIKKDRVSQALHETVKVNRSGDSYKVNLNTEHVKFLARHPSTLLDHFKLHRMEKEILNDSALFL